VKYYVYDDVLVRQITYSDNSSTAQAMARNLAGFSVQNLGNNSIGVRASFQEEHILKNLTTRMRLRNGL
jgi:acylphosphatase